MRPSKEKSQAAGYASCAAPEIGPELSELGPARRIRVLAWARFLWGVVQTMGTRCLFSRTRGKQPKTKFFGRTALPPTRAYEPVVHSLLAAMKSNNPWVVRNVPRIDKLRVSPTEPKPYS